MPRRPNFAVVIQDSTAPQQDSHAKNLAILRTQWRWAAFCQFFFTFFPLFALNDVSVADIEYDLVNDTRHVLPRVLQKMLYALSYDRKVSVDNWQTALRKQYNRRAPRSNPIGPEPSASIPSKEEYMEQDAEKTEDEKDQPPNTGEAAISVDNAIRDLNSAAPSPLNEPSSTRHSSVLEDGYTLGSSNSEPTLQPKSINWFDLPMLAKLESMHTIAEWQFHNPTRLRTIMKSDDESATWRIEPIGYDSKGNAYWLIGADRLWIQRAPLKPMTLKRKRPAQKTSEKKTTFNLSAQKAKRLRLSPPGKPSASHQTTLTPLSDRHSRAAKDQAKKRLDAQAKEMAEFNRLASSSNSESRKQASLQPTTTFSSPIMGTRSSARLRGAQHDEWQTIPEEWLNEVKPSRASSRLHFKTGLELDEESVSELTELSEDDSEPSVPELNGHNDEEVEDEEDEQEAPKQGAASEDFIEWETICSALQEWEHIAEQFEKATHYSEKALFKTLVNDIVPVITNELREIDRKRQLEEAVVHRKRSSRIALRESEKQEARAATMRKQEEVEKMSRARRLEARKQREEQERLKREHAREIRKREREARDETMKDQLGAYETKTRVHAEKGVETRNSISPDRKTSSQKANVTDISSGSHTPVGEDWELACEICNRQGINLDDGTPMMSCGTCSRWQHIQCHDRADRMAGRPRRNWNSEEFICSYCRATQRVQYNNYQLPASKEVPSHDSPPCQAHAPPQLNMPSSSSSVSHQDYRASSHYLSGYNNSHPYGRLNGQQYPNSQYPSSLAGHSILSFSHYQPSQPSFLPNAANKPPRPNVQSLYAHANNAFQQPRHDFISSQTPAWSVDVAQSPGGSAHSDTTPILPISSYMSSQTDNHTIPVRTYSNHEPQTSYTRYSTDSLSTGYKQPVPYQTASRR